MSERSKLVIYLVFIYPKSERDNITRKELHDLLREIESDLE